MAKTMGGGKKGKKVLCYRILGNLMNRDKRDYNKLQFGYTTINMHLYCIGKHENGKCRLCNQAETHAYGLLQCIQYSLHRVSLKK